MKKLTYEFVKEQIESVKGYKLLSTEYINANTKLKIQCDKGHEYNNTYGHFYTGQRCPVCVGNQKHSYEYVKGEIESKGYKLLSKEYINSRTKLRLECPKGHECKLDYHDFKKGMGCITCAGNQKLKIDKILGLVHHNIYIDNPSYDQFHNLISARVRIYSAAGSVGTANDIIGTYDISAPSNNPGKFVTWSQVSV